MPVHLLKLCVGVDTLEELVEGRERHVARCTAQGLPLENIHRTRNFPRRADEVLDGGSLYWIIKGYIRARQRILRFDTIEDANGEAIKRCGIVMESVVVPTVLQARRPHQGWRYLEDRDAPADLPSYRGLADEDAPPPDMAAELRDLGLI